MMLLRVVLWFYWYDFGLIGFIGYFVVDEILY